MFFLLLSIAVFVCATTLCARTTVPVGNDTFVFLRTGEILRGELLGVDSDSVSLVASETMRLACADIERIIGRHNSRSERGFFYGSLFGGLGLGLLTKVATGQPGMFVEMRSENSPDRAVHPDILFAAMVLGLGGGGGMLLDPGSDAEDAIFSFSGYGDGDRWEQVCIWLRGAETGKKLRLSATSAWVVRGMGAAFDRHTRAAGGFVDCGYFSSYYFNPYFGGDHADIDAATNVNLLRRVQVAYEVLPAIESGVAVVWTGEPVVYGNRATERAAEFSSIRQELNGRGYYAMALYNAGFSSLPRVDIIVGCGLGAAQTTYKLDGVAGTYTNDHVIVLQRYDTEISTTHLSAVVTADCSYRLYSGLSVGVTADYVFTPSSRVIPAIPFAGYPEQNFAPGNGSVGITIGIYF